MMLLLNNKGSWKLFVMLQYISLYKWCINFCWNSECCFTLWHVVFFCSASSGPSGESSKAIKTPAEPATGSKRSIQEMTDKSEIYKSLFTSHSTAKRTKDQLSNWVTHTPYHFWAHHLQNISLCGAVRSLSSGRLADEQQMTSYYMMRQYIVSFYFVV